ETGGRNGGLLRMTTQATREQRREMTLYRQTDHYQLTTRGVDLMTTVRIDAHGDPLARLTLNVDPGLRIISVRIGGNDVPWTVATDPATQQLRATIEPTTAMVGTGNTLQIQAIAPLAVGELWQLPRMRFGGMFWQ